MARRWFRLDTAALIFPAIARRDWCNVFRVSATLREPVDTALLQRAVDDTKARFPTFFVRLRKGFFWYYLEESREPLRVRQDYAYPLTYMSSRELKRNCMRVLVYENRIAVECFHALTDGRGGITYLTNLVARYLALKDGLSLPAGDPIRDLREKPPAEELEDSFLKNAAEVAMSRREEASWRLRGTREPRGYRHLITGIAEAEVLRNRAREMGVSVTSLLAGTLALSILEMQAEARPNRKRRRPVKITIPVDLRRLYGSRTLRNFSLVLNLGVDPRYGDYTLEELCRSMEHQLRAGATPQNMAGMIAANVQPQQVLALRLAPVWIKNAVMDLVYRRSGEMGGINLSNLGLLKLPAELDARLERAEFVIGPQRTYPNNCSVISQGGRTYINMIRNIRESELERRFFSHLVEAGIPIAIESNRRMDECTA